MEQTQHDIPLLTEMPNNLDDTRQNDPFSESTTSLADANGGKSPLIKNTKRSIEITRSEVSKASPAKSKQNIKNDQEKIETLQTFQEMEDYNGFGPESPQKQSPREVAGDATVTNFFS